MRTSILFLAMILFCTALFIESLFTENLGIALFSVSILATLAFAKFAFKREFTDLEIRAERKILDQLVYQDKPVSVAVDARNDGVRMRLRIEDVLPDNAVLAAGSNLFDGDLARGEIAKIRYSVRPLKRGMMRLEGLKVTAFGRAGLYFDEKSVPLVGDVTVHLKEESLRRGLAIAKREKLEVTHLSRQRWLRTRDYEFHGIRDYSPGDRFRDIYWRSLAMMDKLLTKIYEKEAMIPTTILLDCSRSMRLTMGEGAKIDHGVHLSLELSKILLSGYHPTGIVLFDELGVIGRLPPSLKRGQFEHVLKVLRSAPPHIESAAVRPMEEGNRTPMKSDGEDDEFLSTIAAFSSKDGTKQTRVGLEGIMRTGIAKGRRKGQLYVLISDLEASRDSILKGASLAVANEHQMVLATPFTFWYEGEDQDGMKVERLEQMYISYGDKLETEKALQRLGVITVDIGPMDEAVKITRVIRRKLS